MFPPYLVPIGLITSTYLAVATLLSSNVIVVAPSGGQFTDIQPAIDAAANGDTILVKAGTYSSFAIVGRARLDVVADAGASVHINGTVRVRNCTGYIVLSGLVVTAHDSTNTNELHGLSLTDNTGPVRVMACTLSGAPAGAYCYYGHGALVQGSNDVEFAACTFLGSTIGWPGGSAGLVCSNSSVAVYDSAIHGGDSRCLSCGYIGADGGDGADVETNSFLFASRSDFHGGQGANTGDGTGSYGSADAGDGGSGVHVAGSSAVHFLDCATQGGRGGFTTVGYSGCSCGCCALCCSCYYDGYPGAATNVAGGSSLDLLAGFGRTFTLPTVVRELHSVNLQIGGQPGDMVSVAILPTAGFTWQPAFEGVALGLQTSLPRWMILGQIGAGGILNSPIAIPDLGTGVLARNYYLQTLHRDTQGNFVLGTGRTLVVLDSSL
jgi:hypothetical protein